MDETQVSLQTCPDCAAQMPEGASFCPACGRSMQVQTRAHGKIGALPETLAGALAYFTFLPALVFLFLEPYRRNVFVRFHSMQSLLLSAMVMAVGGLLKLAALILFIVPVLGPLLVVLTAITVALAAVLIWVVLVVKALQGEMFKLPLLGDFAERYAASI
jgi:Predicted membrane protein